MNNNVDHFYDNPEYSPDDMPAAWVGLVVLGGSVLTVMALFACVLVLVLR